MQRAHNLYTLYEEIKNYFHSKDTLGRAIKAAKEDFQAVLGREISFSRLSNTLTGCQTLIIQMATKKIALIQDEIHRLQQQLPPQP